MQVYKYLNDHDILTPKQFGCRPKMSTGVALAHFSDTILNNMDKGSVTGAVFLDLLQARLTLYNSLVLPLFDYGDIVWGDKNNSTLMENLQTLQNKAAKIILDHHPQSSATDGEALDSLGWKPPLHLRRRFHRCTTIFKYWHGFIDINFHFVGNSSIHNYSTRSRDDFQLSLVRTNWGKQRFIYQSVVDWNSLIQDTRDTSFLSHFKSKLKLKL